MSSCSYAKMVWQALMTMLLCNNSKRQAIF